MDNQLKVQLQEEVMSILNLTVEIKDEVVYKVIDQVLVKRRKEEFFPLKTMIKLRRSLFNSIRRLDVLQDLIDQKEITEIMINGYDQIFVEKAGKITKWEEKFLNKEKYHDVIQQIVSTANRVVNESTPIVDARLEDGSRVHVVLEPISLDGSALTIRKFPETALTMNDLVKLGALDTKIANLLELLVKSGANIFISGGTGSGKTTFLNALSGYIEPDKRVVTIEDSAELQLIGMSNLVRMESRNANMEGNNRISIRDLLKASLRMRPDFIIVGEVRGEEALDMLQALNTGHSGFSTGHANHCYDMLSRIETMVLMGMDMPLPAIQGQIASAIDIIVHLGRLRDRSRKVLEIMEVLSFQDGKIQTNLLFRFEESEEREGKIYGTWEQKGNLIHRDKLALAGHLSMYTKIEQEGL